MVVQVLLNKTVRSINKVYDYLVPDELIPNIQIGKRVKVSFGNSKKFDEGVIVKILDTSGYNKKLKYICEILDDVSFIDMSKLKLAKWMSYMYFCNVYDALKLFFMPGTNNINNSKSVSIDYETHLKLIKYDTVKKIKHQQILDYLKGIDSINIKDVMSYFNVSLSVINTLVKNKYIEKIKVLEDKVTNYNLTKSFDLKLNLEQDNALKNINNLNNKYNVTLLHGVTGSGKTEVYLQAIKKVIDDNKNVIVLVPEISLTHQTEERFISRFGNIVSMIHSKINMKKRKQVYLDILNNKTRIVIGARSAIFAPLKNIGLIIIDEEHDSSYESFTTPKYSTFEVADYLARENNCMLLLGSATPNVNTYYNAINGKYNLIKINNRVNNKLPVIEIVDKKQDSLSNTGNISNRLINEIKVNILNNEQTIIFLNKRGYSSYLTCIDCKSVYKCKKCDVAMTLHKSSNLLICHYCGNVEKNINKCNVCGSNNIKDSCYGTEKIEEELINKIPNISILRMDRDTTFKNNSHNEILNKFKDDNINVLIGTQMVSKGHDIENVTLVGVLGVDSLLNMNDYLASEKAYSNISQVSGRAGRGNKGGRVIIETFDTTNSILNYALNNDYESFYKDEILFRKSFNYPPFISLLNIELSSNDIIKLKLSSNMLYNILLDNNYTVYSPETPFIEKVNNKFRVNILIKFIKNKKNMDILHDKLDKYYLKNNTGVNISIKRS